MNEKNEKNEINEIHERVTKILDNFIRTKNIPHIIFHGPSGSGKRTIFNEFIKKIYDYDESKKEKFTMFVDCAHGKGIKFIRDELKFFAKMNINNKISIFKSIVLFNADYLTIDAQSALRRCIEKFSHTTRFFIIVENKNLLLKPIISRFCNIYLPFPTIDDNKTNLHKYNKMFVFDDSYVKKRRNKLLKLIKNKNHYETMKSLTIFVNKLYEMSYSGMDIMDLIKNNFILKKDKDKYLKIIYFNKIRLEYRNEKLFMLIVLYFSFMRKKLSLENIL